MSVSDPQIDQYEPTGDPGETASAARPGFRAWRRSRPFWGGLLAIIGGVELVLVPLAPMPVVIHQGIAGIGSYLIGVLLAVLGVLLWFQPAQRTFYGVVAVLLSLASFVTSNFGGFIIGMLLGLIGGSLAFAWAPGRPERKRAGRRARRGGSHVFGLAMLPLLAAAPMAAGQSTASQSCLISFLCPSASPQSSTSSTPSTTQSGSPKAGTPSVPGIVPTPSPSLPGKPGDLGSAKNGGRNDQGGDDQSTNAKAKKKAKGEAARFVPTRKHLPAKHADAGQAPVSVQANTLTAASMTQYGLSFDGVVAMPTAHGSVRMLKFSADRVVMTGSDLASGRTSTGQSRLELNGNVHLYTTKLHGKLFGIPLTFTPDFPPPAVLPKMTMTDVTSTHNFTVADTARLDDLDLRTS